MPEITPAGFAILPDGTALIAVVETVRVRRWFRTFELSSTETYLLKAGSWWGREGSVPLRDPRHRRLCELAMQARVGASIDDAVNNPQAAW